MSSPYPGNIPSNVGKDAKYSVRTGKSGTYMVTLRYWVDDRERALLATDAHQALVDLVNTVKNQHNGRPGRVVLHQRVLRRVGAGDRRTLLLRRPLPQASRVRLRGDDSRPQGTAGIEAGRGLARTTRGYQVHLEGFWS